MSPFSVQSCPNSAACWSPATAEIAIFAPTSLSSVYPKRCPDAHTFGSMLCGTPNNSHSSSSQRSAPMSNSIVRLALV